MMSALRSALAIALAALALSAGAARAAILEPIGEFNQPTYVTSEPENPEHLLVVERRGKIELVDEETLDEEGNAEVSTFADLSSLVACGSGGCTGERGLMSIALAPDYAQSGHLYVDYAQDATGELHVDELTASGEEAPLSSLRPLLTIPHPGDNNHNGGQLELGPEGDLFISTGDGGGGNDSHHNSQNPLSLLGKILRIDPAESEPTPAVWALGLRNPFRFSFDRLDHDMVIGDVGQGLREEVDYAPAGPLGQVGGEGANYGWNCREGFSEGPGDDLPDDQCETTSFVEPVFDYPHLDPEDGSAHGCAIIGGYVVRDHSVGDLYGRYVYADLCAGEIRSMLLPATAGGLASDDRYDGLSVASPVSFGEDSCRRVYVVSGEGEVSRLAGDEPAGCSAPPEEPPPEEPPPHEEGPHPDEGAPSQPPGQSPPQPLRLAQTVGITAAKGTVQRGGRVTLTVRVSPCDPAEAERVGLHRGGRPSLGAALDGDCAAVFRPRVGGRSTFRAVLAEDATHAGSRSRRLTIVPG